MSERVQLRTLLCTLVLVSALFGVASTSNAATPLTTQTMAGTYTQPVYVTAPPGDPTRLFVVEKDGVIKIIKNGSPLGTPFMDITTRVRNDASERGLLGLAFHPNYASNGYFYVNYTGNSAQSVTSRFKVSGNPDIADTSVEDTLLSIPDFANNHNGGWIGFSPNDGYLYIALGDGGSSDDPGNRAQNLDTLWGKMLRIDVDHATGYSIPPDNPFLGANPGRDEIWAYGLRNPWRPSFDRLTGDLWIADVGQNIWEEIDFQPANSPGGENWGWRYLEAFLCHNPTTNCDPQDTLDDPITAYSHLNSRCSISGGYVYRGCAIPDLQGSYFYGDYCTGEVWSIKYNGTNVTDSIARNSTLGQGSFNLVSFGEDALGELYIVTINSGRIYKIVPDGVAPVPCGPCCENTVGNVDGDTGDSVDISDLTVLIDHLFISFNPLACDDEANIDGTGTIDIGDLTLLIDILFITFQPFGPCPTL